MKGELANSSDVSAISERPEGARILRLPASGPLAEVLRQMIAQGDLEGGTRLQEVALAARLGVSRAPLREALRSLAAEGLVETIPNKGARVVDIGPERYRQVLSVVTALEQAAAEDACRNASEAQILEITSQHYTMLKYAALEDLRSYFRLNIGIHQMIVDLAGNPVLSDTYRRLNNLIWRPRFKSHTSKLSGPAAKLDFARSIVLHQAILHALSIRNVAALKDAILRHHAPEMERDVRHAPSPQDDQ